MLRAGNEKTSSRQSNGLHFASDLRTSTHLLGGLPLCVSIYSDWLVFSRKGKRTPDIQESLHAVWRNIEERFTDKFHQRGLTGVLQCAESYLKDHPMVVFLLAKICSTNCESVPWEMISTTANETYFDKIDLQGKMWDGWFSSLVCVIDWLFSLNGQETLEECRDAVEELI